jgi:hypothetical protein
MQHSEIKNQIDDYEKICHVFNKAKNDNIQVAFHLLFKDEDWLTNFIHDVQGTHTSELLEFLFLRFQHTC